MATEQEAKRASTTHATKLQKLGAHAIGTMGGEGFGLMGHVVVAHVRPGFKGKLPSTIGYTKNGVRITVPVVTKETEPFKPEKL